MHDRFSQWFYPSGFVTTVAAAGLALCGLADPAVAQDAKGIEFFEKKIRPVLVAQCYSCHSATSEKLKGGLRLDTKEGLLAGGQSGPALVPGKPKQGTLLSALRYEDFEMPPSKKLPDAVLADFAKWVEMGAPDPRGSASQPEGPASVEEGRKFWSFQPVAAPKPPTVKNKKWAESAIDRFVLARLEEEKLQPVAQADRRTLIRRLSLDLIGLPPTYEEITAFEADRSPNAVEKLVDRLLASPHFGERWGRHWLDVARYGESNGNVRNSTFPHAWRYRDYVIRAFNEDRPYDRFLSEQLAGDLLPFDSAEQRNTQLVATGFLAIGSKPNAQGNPNFQMDVVADQIEVTSLAIMGLTVGCARCHDHKYDPVPTRDYYALAGIFTSSETLYGASGNNMGGAPPTPLHQLLKDGDEKRPMATEAAAEPDDAGGNGKRKQNKKNNRGGPVPSYPKDAELAMGVRDRASPSDSRINIKGETRQLGASVPRGFVQVCSPENSPTISEKASGRLELAKWLTDGRHPLTARVAVNRVWHHLFGAGIVRSTDNFGLHGDRPSHPELLDHLATRFVAEGWSFKKLIREIVLTKTYQLSSASDEKALTTDPDNNLLWRHSRKRFDAESFRDAVLLVSGRLTLTPRVGSDVVRIGEALIQDRLTPDAIHKPSTHRSIYLTILRNGEPEDLTIFDLADPSLVVGVRNVTTVPSQALYLLNSPLVVKESRHLAATALAEKGTDGASLTDSDRVGSIYRRVLQREPTSSERNTALELISDFTAAVAESKRPAEETQERAWAALVQSLLATNEFRHID